MADQKHEETFKVVDRRWFNKEGELRQEAIEQEQREKDAPPAKPAPAGKMDSSASVVRDTEAPRRSPSFENLVNSLATNAALMLGAYPDPRTGQALLDLEGAREVIDILDALKEKTRGNLAAEEDQLLVDLLGKLKISYVEMTKHAAKAVPEKSKARP